MDNPERYMECEGTLTRPYLPEISDLPEDPDVSESTGLSPVTSKLDLHEDNPLLNDNSMGIANTWTETNSSTSDYVIPVSPTPCVNDFSDIGTDTLVGEGSIEYGPLLPDSTFNNFYSDAGDGQNDSVIGECPPEGVCGLHNLGNTCFMAAGLQCLTATPPVLQHFLELQQQSKKYPPPGSLMANFSSLLSQMWSGEFRTVKPLEFKQTLGAYHSQFKDYRQHDCQEFLALLLDSLHEQLNVVKNGKTCNVPTASATTASSIVIHENGEKESLGSFFNDTINTMLMESCDSTSLSNCPNSPDITVAGSPRGLDSPIGDLDSIVNSPFESPLNDDEEETLDSEEIIAIKSNFIFNKMQEYGETGYAQETLRIDNILELSNNRSHLCDYDIYDIMKDAKTSNANFLVTQQECNNEIYYDSQKFPKENNRRSALDNSNLTENHDFDNKSVTIKRIKEINVQKNNCSVECGISSGSAIGLSDSGLEKCNVKRMRLEDQEKNHRRDGLGPSDLQCSRLIQSHENGAVASENEVEADKHWTKHLTSNKSVIVDTFQGQFKSTVVCEVCKHISVTYEPFMYLSVPLPHAMEKQLVVTYIPANGEPPIRSAVCLNKQSRVSMLKKEVLRILDKTDIPLSHIALVEVLDHHIARTQDDDTLVKYVDAIHRTIWAIELMDPPEAYILDHEGGGDKNTETEACQNGTSSTEKIENCKICLYEAGSGYMHRGNPCDFLICDDCIVTFFTNGTESPKCPVCSTQVTRESFYKIDQTSCSRPAVRILNVPVVIRHDNIEATNNRNSTQLLGYPHLIKLPSRVNAKDLWECIKRIAPKDGDFTLIFVDGQGIRCSRCIFTDHCTGCPVRTTGMVQLQSSDTLAVRYTENVPKIPSPIDHISYIKHRPRHPLSLYDCLRAFSQSETLDELNPWFCPKCERNQCATKTLTVNRYPKFLIVYLKRFVFYECSSMKLSDKVTFPLAGLDVGDHRYDLYACVCHFGGVSAGHYTAYAKNPKTGTWHYYNDELTSKQKPQEEDYSNAYILFYSRQETSLKPCNI